MTIDEAKVKLQTLQDDPGMKTVSKYSPTASDWPDNQLPFVEIHLAYLRAHKLVNPAHYLSNLELIIKKR
jgi:hypothetical protein